MHAIFRRHLVISYAFLGKDRADAHLFAVLIGGMALFDGIGPKAWALIDTEHAGNATYHAANGAADNGANRTGRTVALARAALDSTRYALGLSDNGNSHCGANGGSSDKTADHDELLQGQWIE